MKRSGANLLGGRALLYQLHPFTVKETDGAFELEWALQWGTLPPLIGLKAVEARQTLKAYVEIYLREEIQMEGLVRNVGGFTRFLDQAAAYGGEILNYSSLAKEAGLPIKTVQSYFEILEDTHRATPAGLDQKSTQASSQPSQILPVRQWGDQRAYPSPAGAVGAGDAEVDLLVELNGRLALAVEFKSRSQVGGSDLSGFRSFREDYPDVPCVIVCTAPEAFRLEPVEILPWRAYLSLIENLLK